MNILLIIDKKRYKYHGEIELDFESALVNYFENRGENSLEVIDVGVNIGEYEMFSYLKSKTVDFIITVDFAGFNMTTTSDTLSFNGLHARMAHILLQKREMYSSLLNYRQNISMFTYFQKGEDIDLLIKKYPGITNIREIDRIYYKNLSKVEHEQNVDVIEKWLDVAMRDMRYNETFNI